MSEANMDNELIAAVREKCVRKLSVEEINELNGIINEHRNNQSELITALIDFILRVRNKAYQRPSENTSHNPKVLNIRETRENLGKGPEPLKNNSNPLNMGNSGGTPGVGVPVPEDKTVPTSELGQVNLLADSASEPSNSVPFASTPPQNPLNSSASTLGNPENTFGNPVNAVGTTENTLGNPGTAYSKPFTRVRTPSNGVTHSSNGGFVNTMAIILLTFFTIVCGTGIGYLAYKIFGK